MQLYTCVVMACPTNLYMIRIKTDFYIILGQKYGLPFQNCGMYAKNKINQACHMIRITRIRYDILAVF